jgi:hypothetical protein
MEHITAADHLRALADGARIGFTGGRDLSMPIQAVLYRPPSGPSGNALHQTRCERQFRQAMRIFDDGQRDLVECLILRNEPVNRWRLARGVTQWTAMQRLMTVLEMLVVYFDDELRKYGVAA